MVEVYTNYNIGSDLKDSGTDVDKETNMNGIKAQDLKSKLELKQLELDLKEQENRVKNYADEELRQKEWSIHEIHQQKCETARRNLDTIQKYISLEVNTNIIIDTIWNNNHKMFQKAIKTNLTVLINKNN